MSYKAQIKRWVVTNDLVSVIKILGVSGGGGGGGGVLRVLKHPHKTKECS